LTRPESDPIDAQLLERYRKASDADPAAPTDAVRAAILAEARRVAEQSASSPQPVFDTSQPAANQPRWRMAAFGTLGAALLAALIVAPRLWEHPPDPLTATNQPAPAMSAPADAAPPGNAAAVNAPAPNATAPDAPAPNARAPIARAPIAARNAAAPHPALNAAPAAAEPASPPPMAGLQAPSESQLAEADSASSVQRAVTAAATPGRTAALMEQRKAAQESLAAEHYTPDPKIADALSGRVSSFAARPAAPASAAGARALAGAPAGSLGAAAASGDSAGVNRLLDQGATLDARDDLGRTPLMMATLNGQAETVKILLGRGADPNIADNGGHTALQMAQSAHRDEIAQLLQDAGAR
jgi:hypothetical protein